MHQYQAQTDTIAAIATPSGVGALAIVRVSGKECRSLVEKIFKDPQGRSIAGWPSFTARYGWIVNNGLVVDEAVVTLMLAPKSYTTEDMAEISCHGGELTVRAVLETCLQGGVRLAEPGEFTKRAFLNGRIDLTQAEAVLDVVNATNEGFLRASRQQLKGDLLRELDSIRDVLVHVMAEIEAHVNFPEDTDSSWAQQPYLLDEQLTRIRRLLATVKEGRVLREGIRIVICGKPNVGKSSLLNALLREPRAIVTDVAGTTRDVLEEYVNIDSVPVRLADTAGILSPRDKVEEEAVARSRKSIESADIILFVLDQSSSFEHSDQELMNSIDLNRTIVVLNKSDLPTMLTGDLLKDDHVRVSALTGAGLTGLKQRIVKSVLGTANQEAGRGLMISNVRHAVSLRRAEEALVRASESVRLAHPPEFLTEDLKSAINGLDAVTGRNVDTDVIDAIFSRFCIGK